MHSEDEADFHEELETETQKRPVSRQVKFDRQASMMINSGDAKEIGKNWDLFQNFTTRGIHLNFSWISFFSPSLCDDYCGIQ